MRVGCDIVAICRIEKILERYGVAFLKKFLSENELENLAFLSGNLANFLDEKLVNSRENFVNLGENSVKFSENSVKFGENLVNLGVNLGENSATKNSQNYAKFGDLNTRNLSKISQNIAGIWAAKEAVSKALGVGICEDFGFLDVEILKDTKNAPKLKFSPKAQKKFAIKSSSISIAHDGGFAIAVVNLACFV